MRDICGDTYALFVYPSLIINCFSPLVIMSLYDSILSGIILCIANKSGSSGVSSSKAFTSSKVYGCPRVIGCIPQNVIIPGSTGLFSNSVILASISFDNVDILSLVVVVISVFASATLVATLESI